jgi:hypothetical protein
MVTMTMPYADPEWLEKSQRVKGRHERKDKCITVAMVFRSIFMKWSGPRSVVQEMNDSYDGPSNSIDIDITYCKKGWQERAV